MKGVRPAGLLLALLANCTLVACTGNNDSRASELLSCFDDCLAAKTSWMQFLDDRPPCLKAAKVWWPAARPAGTPPNLLPVTLVTQLSVDRMEQVKAQCSTWLGPLAAAVYLPLVNPDEQLSDANQAKITAAIVAVQEVLQSVEAEGKCELRVLLLYEVFQAQKASALYPVNSLRNYARLMANTELIANIDVDMIPSATLSQSLQQLSVHELVQGCKEQKAVYVLPAFETRCGGASYADRVSLYSKDKLWREDPACVGQFRGKVAVPCHNATDYARWFRQDTAYMVAFAREFEPWFISYRGSTRWYDVRYRGYGKNKIVQVNKKLPYYW